MQIHKGLYNLPDFKNAVLKRINDIAQEINGESILLTFDPHPRLVLHPNDDTLKLISTIDEKEELLETFGLNHLVIAVSPES